MAQAADADDVPQTRTPRDILVIGAGVVGCATALTLAERGHRVQLLDAGAGPGLATSYANGAQLSYAYTDALASPALRRAIPRVLAGRDPAFRVRLRLDPDFLRWGLAFLRNCTAAAAAANTIAGLALAARSRHALDGLMRRHGLVFGHARLGKIIVHRSARSLDAAGAAVALKAAHGVDQRLLSRDQAVALEPLLADTADSIAGAVHDTGEAVGDPHRFCTEASAALARIAGCGVRFGARVTAIEARGRLQRARLADGAQLAADEIIVCAGPETNRLTAPLGVRLPIAAIKGHSITAPPTARRPRLSITDAARRLVVAPLGDRIRIAGLADLGARDAAVDPARLAQLVDDARAALPGAADYGRIESSWAGLRPVTPTSLPIVRRIAPGVSVNAGHGALGWTYAAGCAGEVADIIDGAPRSANDPRGGGQA
jgi:D-amino-acid dehydrogenase